MRENKKAHFSAATLEQATETMDSNTSFPCSHSITGQHKMQGKIERLLLHGENNAIPTKMLVQLAGVKSPRQLQSEIEHERLNGALILSTAKNGGGYFLPAEGQEGEREIKDFARTVNARAVNSLRTLRAAKRALGRMDGQHDMWEE